MSQEFARAMPLNFAIIGCGRMGYAHSQRLQNDGRGQVVALLDENPAMAGKLRDEVAPAAVVVTDFSQLAEIPRIDAVVVCTPTSAHYEQTMACREQGWHVLCEKPLADTRDHILSLAQAATNDGPVLSVAYQRRYWSTYRKLRELVLSQEYGRLCSVTSVNCERWQQTITGTWRDDPQINVGGFIGDAGSHKIDILFYVTGLTPVNVFARCQNHGSRVEITASAVGELSGGVPYNFSFVGNSESFVEDLQLHCERASLFLHNSEIHVARDNRLEKIDVPANEWGIDSIRNPTVGFLDQLLDNNAVAVAPAECALPVFDFTQALLESNRRGAQVEIALA